MFDEGIRVSVDKGIGSVGHCRERKVAMATVSAPCDSQMPDLMAMDYSAAAKKPPVHN